MSGGRLVVIGGGVRSGKSSFALARAKALGARRVFIATAERSDDEMRARIERHVAERGAELETREVSLAVPEAIATMMDSASAPDVIVVDCATLWLSNLLLAGRTMDAALTHVDDLVCALRSRSATSVVVVTNEVGMGIVPATPLGRTFRDLAGLTNQRLAAAADEVYLAAMGLVLRLRPGPVEVAG